MDTGVQIAAIIAASIVVPVTAGIIMGGFYFVTAYKQEQLNLRENLRAQRALAKVGATSEGGEGNDLMALANVFLPLLMKNGQKPPGVTDNGEIQQGPGVGGP